MIPNNSILIAFRKNILDYFTKDKSQLAKVSEIVKAIFNGNEKSLRSAINDALSQYISIRDFSSNEPKESYYQGFLNGFFSSQKELLKGYASNAELGNGYADITFTNKDGDIAVIIEIKHSQEKENCKQIAITALDQIDHKEYYQKYMRDLDITNIYCFGICFYKKSCSVAFKDIKK